MAKECRSDLYSTSQQSPAHLCLLLLLLLASWIPGCRGQYCCERMSDNGDQAHQLGAMVCRVPRTFLGDQDQIRTSCSECPLLFCAHFQQDELQPEAEQREHSRLVAGDVSDMTHSEPIGRARASWQAISAELSVSFPSSFPRLLRLREHPRFASSSLWPWRCRDTALSPARMFHMPAIAVAS